MAVLVGAGQLTQREEEPQRAMSPPELMAEAARRAALDAGAGPALLEKIDYLGVVGTLGWRASNPARLVAEAIGARPAQEVVSTVGGDTPQAWVNHVADEIAKGSVRLALLTGCNAMHTAQRASALGLSLDWPVGGEGIPAWFGDSRPGSNDYENRHGLILPSTIYPLFENAFRARRGWDLETHRRKLGELFSDFSRVAARNEYSWFPVARTPEDWEAAAPTRIRGGRANGRASPAVRPCAGPGSRRSAARASASRRSTTSISTAAFRAPSRSPARCWRFPWTALASSP
jgi:acetyl-CoA C-acetyltransferase